MLLFIPSCQFSSESYQYTLSSATSHLPFASTMASEKMEIEEDYKSELVAFGQRVKARREAGLYSPVWIRKEWLILTLQKRNMHRGT